jgi:broad specificity phosphatase PhoE
MTRLFLARHGETDWNLAGRLQGQAGPSLNAAGRRQALSLTRALAPVPLDAIYASDLPRAVETAEIVAGSRGMKVMVDPALREVHVGSWSGLTRAEIAERFPDAVDHDGETREEFTSRVLAASTRIAAAHDDAQVLVVTHGGFVRALQRQILGEPLPVLANCGVYRLAYEAGAFRPLG